MYEEEDIIIQEKCTQGPKASKEQLNNIEKQMVKGVCKIKKERKKGTGFFVKLIDERNKKIGALITNSHILGNNDIGKDNDIITYYLNNKENHIKNMKGRRRYINEILDITIVEIKEKDEIEDEHYLELDDIKSNPNYKIENQQKVFEDRYKGNAVYAIGYPEGNDIIVSFGNIDGIHADNPVLTHTCDTTEGSSGSAIFSNENFRVFAIHTGYFLHTQKNRCVIIFPAINAFLNSKDILTYIEDPKKEEKEKKLKEWKEKEEKEKKLKEWKEKEEKERNDKENKEPEKKINSMIIKYKVKADSENIKIFGKKFISKNKSNCKMSIIDDSTNLSDITEYFTVNETMRKNRCFYIKLIETNPITDMSYIFGKFYHNEGVVQIQKLKAISWDTKNVINMSKFFCECNELIDVSDLSKLDTQNVKDMSFFFFGCEKLEKIEGIEKWKMDNVENMSNMFAYCKMLKTLSDFKEWNVENVKDLSYMFYECESIDRLKGIQNWKVKSLKNHKDFISGCKSLSPKPNISSWKNIII